MTETNERITVDFDIQSYYLDGEYWESWDNYGEEMADKINELLKELEKENKDLEEARSYYQENFLTMKTERHQLKEENKELKNEIEKIAYANDDLLKEKRAWKKMSDEYAKIYDENKKLKQQYSALEVTLMNNQLAYNDLEKENEQLKQQLKTKYIVNRQYEELQRLKNENKELKKRLSHAEKVNIGLIDENHRLRLTLIHSSDLNFDINWLKENLNDWNNKE